MIKDTIIRSATPADAESLLQIYSPYITDISISFETDVPTIEEFASRIESITERYPYLVYELNKHQCNKVLRKVWIRRRW